MLGLEQKLLSYREHPGLWKKVLSWTGPSVHPRLPASHTRPPSPIIMSLWGFLHFACVRICVYVCVPVCMWVCLQNNKDIRDLF